MKRILVVSDLHCGHVAGLTPKRWHSKNPDVANRKKFLAIQQEGWRWYCREVQKYGPYDMIVCNGDAVDGRGERSGSIELIAVDRSEQCDMATEALEVGSGPNTKMLFTFGTTYHTGALEDWEKTIADGFDAPIKSHAWIDAEGVVLDFRHEIGSSSVPYGRGTAVAKAAIWSQLTASQAATPEADILIRSHVHYHTFGGDLMLKPGLRMTTPALQAMGTRFGARRCSGLTDFGFVVFECSKGSYSWQCHHKRLESEKATAIKV